MHYRRWMKHGTTDDPAVITHCIAGHEYTPANTYRDGLGKRHCATCRAAASTASYLRRVAAGIEFPGCAITECPRTTRGGAKGLCAPRITTPPATRHTSASSRRTPGWPGGRASSLPRSSR
jgi:hypothetical protein